ncbi:helix-turn-helix domain-containing protein [Nocardioides sp.]|uniref:helix-turn-helix domain-containing protein n=1 Tax=Nocardioides sp. TaxID=35761 RepID=UPI002724D0D0|nr:helix-turn-helix domain-containing protein [Nocardioides sp.]MDO9458474.1 helix-turn-helix domain-containing protein [Nocardioides sp.]
MTTNHAQSAPSLLMNLDEVADELRCTRRNVERLVAAHELPVVRFGRSVRIERTVVEEFVAEHREPDHRATDHRASEHHRRAG